MAKEKEFCVEFDLVETGYATAYFYAPNLKAVKADVKEELKIWGGGHADIFNAEGDWVADVEV